MPMGRPRSVSDTGKRRNTGTDPSWDEPTGDLLNPTYFVKDTEGQEFQFMQDFWKREHFWLQVQS